MTFRSDDDILEKIKHAREVYEEDKKAAEIEQKKLIDQIENIKQLASQEQEKPPTWIIDSLESAMAVVSQID